MDDDMPVECCDCESFEDAVNFGFIDMVPEVMLPRRGITEINPEATAGNVLTGENYDPADFAVGMAISHCPFCGSPLASSEGRA